MNIMIIIMQTTECWHDFHVGHQLMWRCFYVAGNLCTGVGGKKKKKMMYVTTKNAGDSNTFLSLYIYLFIFAPLSVLPSSFPLILAVVLLAQNLTDMRYCCTRRWPRSHLSRGKVWFWLVLRAWGGGDWRTSFYWGIHSSSAPLFHVWNLELTVNGPEQMNYECMLMLIQESEAHFPHTLLVYNR